MMEYETTKTGVVLIKPQRFVDCRGFFEESYSFKGYQEIGVDANFVQDNHSLSKSVGTLRGMHFQAPPKAQAKLIRCCRGAIFDVAVDIRIGSPTYGLWEGFELSSENGHQLFVPVGFAHGFITLEPDTEIAYKCSEYYHPVSEGSFNWNDQDIGIQWPINNKKHLSKKDREAPHIKDTESPFFYGVNS